MTILAISSQVVAGHVGNSAAQPVLQALGHEVWAIPTVLLSHHPGHGTPAGRATPADELAALIANLEEKLSWMSQITGIMTGYFTSAAQVDVVASAITRIKQQKPNCPVLVDPIMGDAGRIYVADDVPDAIRTKLLPLATITTPNLFELSLLSGAHVGAMTTHETIARAVHQLGIAETLVTSAPADRSSEPDAPDRIATLLFADDETKSDETKRHPHAPNGVGDVTAAAYLGHRLNGSLPADALAQATGTVSALIAMAAAQDPQPGAGALDLPLVTGARLLSD